MKWRDWNECHPPIPSTTAAHPFSGPDRRRFERRKRGNYVSGLDRFQNPASDPRCQLGESFNDFAIPPLIGNSSPDRSFAAPFHKQSCQRPFQPLAACATQCRKWGDALHLPSSESLSPSQAAPGPIPYDGADFQRSPHSSRQSFCKARRTPSPRKVLAETESAGNPHQVHRQSAPQPATRWTSVPATESTIRSAIESATRSAIASTIGSAPGPSLEPPPGLSSHPSNGAPLRPTLGPSPGPPSGPSPGPSSHPSAGASLRPPDPS